MRKRLPTLGRLAVFNLALALVLAAWAKPAWSFHRERKTVTQVVGAYSEIKHHMEEGRLDWHHLREELGALAKPVRALGHHDGVDLFKPLEESVRRRDKEALEEGFQEILFYLIRENLHRSEDSAGNLEETIKGFVKNARMAYRPLAQAAPADQVEEIFREMEATAHEARVLQSKLEAKKKELEEQLHKALKR